MKQPFYILLPAIYGLLLGLNGCSQPKEAPQATLVLASAAEQPIEEFSPESLKRIQELHEFYGGPQGLTRGESLKVFQKFFPKLCPLIEISLEENRTYNGGEFIEALAASFPPLLWARHGPLKSDGELTHALSSSYPGAQKLVVASLAEAIHKAITASQDSKPYSTDFFLALGSALAASIQAEKGMRPEDRAAKILRLSVDTSLWSRFPEKDPALLSDQDRQVQKLIFALQMQRISRNGDNREEASREFSVALDSVSRAEKLREAHRKLFSGLHSGLGKNAEPLIWYVDLSLAESVRHLSSQTIRSGAAHFFPLTAELLEEENLFDNSTVITFMKEWQIAKVAEDILSRCAPKNLEGASKDDLATYLFRSMEGEGDHCKRFEEARSANFISHKWWKMKWQSIR